ncbi:MAG: TIGR03985 family CRISPR-associated protein [Crocosphaera sp.]|nr:TIGR03985 family CRISPR-associated protein [Crocosphaera sp.]
MTSFPSPSIPFLRSFLSPQVSLISKDNFQKAVRCYIYVKALYSQGGCRVNNFPYSLQFAPLTEFHPFSPSEFQNHCLQPVHNLEDDPFTPIPAPTHCHSLTTLQKFKVRDLLFLNLADEQSWKESLLKDYPNLNPTQIENLLDSFPFKKKSEDRLIRLDFQKTLAQQQWIQSHSSSNTTEKKTGTYSKISQQELDNKLSLYQDKFSLTAQEETTPFFKNEFITNLIRQFSPVNNIRILFESECLISDSIPLAQLETLLNTLADNWFNSSPVNPIQLSYKDQKTQTIKTLTTYPVAFIHIQRTFYLYGIESHREDWQAYRMDRIYSVEILDWNHSKVPNTLRTLLDDDELPTIDEVQDELESNILGYAFWNTPKIMLLQFDKNHYNLHIKDNLRSQFFREININNFSKIFQQVSGIYESKHKQEIRHQFESFLKLAQANPDSKNYVFCLATYYEQDLAVRQRLLAWGKKVKVVFPKTLQQEILEEIHSTLQLYQLNF